eukprot:SAG31_NODE_47_length_30979_cov_41.708841_20_plen_71_part_00
MVELKRWAVLAAYNLIGFLQSVVWVTFSASAREARMLYGSRELSSAQINLLRAHLFAVLPYNSALARLCE